MPEKNNQLLDNIKSSIVDMQKQMQETYQSLSGINLIGRSDDKTVEIEMTPTYTLVDIRFGENALEGGVKEFKWRIRESWKNLMEQIQKVTQEKTLELLQGMQIPDEIRNIDMGGEEGGEGGQGGGQGGQGGQGGRGDRGQGG